MVLRIKKILSQGIYAIGGFVGAKKLKKVEKKFDGRRIIVSFHKAYTQLGASLEQKN